MSYWWNHRVVRREFADEVLLGIHEVFYEGDEGKDPVLSVTEGPIAVTGESVEDLQKVLNQMLRCLDKPVLEYKDFSDPRNPLPD